MLSRLVRLCQVYAYKVQQVQPMGNTMNQRGTRSLMNYFSFLRKHDCFCDQILFRYYFCFDTRETVELGTGSLCSCQVPVEGRMGLVVVTVGREAQQQVVLCRNPYDHWLWKALASRGAQWASSLALCNT